MAAPSDLEAVVRKALLKCFDVAEEAVTCVRIEPFRSEEGGLVSSFVAVQFEATRSADVLSVPLLVKCLPDRSERLNLTEQFHNEAYFFEDLLPFLVRTSGLTSIWDMFPRCHCTFRGERQFIVVLENLRPLGFKMAGRTLDFDHANLAVKELARFHALSYVAKKKDPEGFSRMVGGIKQTRVDGEIGEEINSCVDFNAAHPIDLYREFHPEDYEANSHRVEQFRRRIADASALYRELALPEEPLAVVCHGDYNRGNLLFRYGNGASRLRDLKILDLQLLTYSSPAVDLSLLLFMCTTSETLHRHWDEMFAAYNDVLTATLLDGLACGRGDLQEYQPEAFEKDFAKHFLHGYFVTSFFLPMTTASSDEFENFLEIYAKMEKGSRWHSDFLKIVRKHETLETKKKLASLFKELVYRGYV